MFFEITDLAVEEALRVAKSAAAVEHLIQVHSAGWHVVVMSRGAARSLIDSGILSRRLCSILESDILKRAAVLRGELSSVGRFIRCVAGSGVERFDGGAVEIRIDRYSELEACQKSYLLTENSCIDGAFLVELVREFSHVKNSTRPINLELLHGGGGTTADIYSSHINGLRPLFSVVDSDRNFDGDVLGATAQRMVNLGNVGPLNTVMCEVLPCRELENLIPISMLFEVYDDDPKVKEIVSIYHKFKDECPADSYEVLKYCDFKRGGKVEIIEKLPNGIAEKFIRFASYFGVKSIEKMDDKSTLYVGISNYCSQRVLSFLIRKPWLIRDFYRKFSRSPLFREVAPILEVIYAYGVGGVRLPY